MTVSMTCADSLRRQVVLEGLSKSIVYNSAVLSSPKDGYHLRQLCVSTAKI